VKGDLWWVGLASRRTATTTATARRLTASARCLVFGAQCSVRVASLKALQQWVAPRWRTNRILNTATLDTEHWPSGAVIKSLRSSTRRQARNGQAEGLPFICRCTLSAASFQLERLAVHIHREHSSG
jgi:hypothetical protein